MPDQLQESKEEPILSASARLQKLRQFINVKYAKFLAEDSNIDSAQALIRNNSAAQIMNSLNNIFNLKGFNKKKIINAKLKEFLQVKWDTIKGTYLCYTSLPDSPTTIICCAIADFLHAEDVRRINKLTQPKKGWFSLIRTSAKTSLVAENQVAESALSFLMPSIKKYYNFAAIENISELPLQQICQHYIISDNKESLIPISLLSDVDLALEIDRLMVNPFIEGRAALSANEQRRLIHHSPLTEQMIASQEFYLRKVAKGMNLFAAFKKLIEGLRRSSVRGLTGGTERYATDEANKALATFRGYWNRLTAIQKEEVCQDAEFKQKIDRKIINEDWKGCVYLLSNDIEFKIIKNRDKLVKITLDENQENEILLEHRDKFERLKAEFLALLAESDSLKNQYQGSDKLFFDATQLAYLFDQVSEGNLVLGILLASLQLEEMLIVCQNHSSIIKHLIIKMPDFYDIVRMLNSEQSAIFVSQILRQINFNTLRIANSLPEFLNTLQINMIEAFFEGAKNINFNQATIGNLLRHLDVAGFDIFLQSELFIKHFKMPQIIAHVDRMDKIVNAMLAKLDPVSLFDSFSKFFYGQVKVLSLIAEKINSPAPVDNPAVVKYLSHFAVSAEEKSNLQLAKLAEKINTSEYLQVSLKIVPGNYQKELLQLIDKRLCVLIGDLESYHAVIKIFPDLKTNFKYVWATSLSAIEKENLSEQIVAQLDDIQLVEMTGSNQDVGTILKFLSDFRVKTYFDKIVDKLLVFPKVYFYEITYSINDAKIRQEVATSLENRIFSGITSIASLQEAQKKYLGISFYKLNVDWNSLIKNIDDLEIVLAIKNKSTILTAVRDRLINFVVEPGHLPKMLEILSKEEERPFLDKLILCAKTGYIEDEAKCKEILELALKIRKEKYSDKSRIQNENISPAILKLENELKLKQIEWVLKKNSLPENSEKRHHADSNLMTIKLLLEKIDNFKQGKMDCDGVVKAIADLRITARRIAVVYTRDTLFGEGVSISQLIGDFMQELSGLASNREVAEEKVALARSSQA